MSIVHAPKPTRSWPGEHLSRPLPTDPKCTPAGQPQTPAIPPQSFSGTAQGEPWRPSMSFIPFKGSGLPIEHIPNYRSHAPGSNGGTDGATNPIVGIDRSIGGGPPDPEYAVQPPTPVMRPAEIDRTGSYAPGNYESPPPPSEEPDQPDDLVQYPTPRRGYTVRFASTSHGHGQINIFGDLRERYRLG